MLAGVLALMPLTACNDTDTPTGSSETTTSATTSAAPTSTTDAGAVTEAAAGQLCDMIRPELSNFRVQGPTLGRISLNAMVHEWALRNGGINAQILADKPIVDRVTTSACADVRTEALTALELPDLASGLAF